MKKKSHKKNKFLIALIFLTIITGIVTNLSVAKFQSIQSPSSQAAVARWKIKINEADVTSSDVVLTNKMTLKPEQNSNVEVGKLAPGYGGYFDIIIDSTGTQVGLGYNIKWDKTKLPTDIEIIAYGDENIEDSTFATAIEEGTDTITGTLTQQEEKTIRVFWMWNDVRDNDLAHTQVALEQSNYAVNVEVVVTQNLI